MQITIYSTPTCPFCKMAKDFLNDLKVGYEEVNVADDSRQLKNMVAKTGQQGVPVIILKTDKGAEEIVVGFDKTKLLVLLGK